MGLLLLLRPLLLLLRPPLTFAPSECSFGL